MIALEEHQADLSEMPLREWRCTGQRQDGRPCRQVLAEYAAEGGIRLRKRCDKCGTWNTTERYPAAR